MSRRDDDARAWEVQRAKNADHQRQQKLVRDVSGETYEGAKANGYSESDARILSIAISKLAGRTGGRHV